MVPKPMLSSSSLYMKLAHPNSHVLSHALLHCRKKCLEAKLKMATYYKKGPPALRHTRYFHLRHTLWKPGEIMHRKRRSFATTLHMHSFTRGFRWRQACLKARHHTAKDQAEQKQLRNTTHWFYITHIFKKIGADKARAVFRHLRHSKYVFVLHVLYNWILRICHE